jgi:hypothetical protein
MKDTACQSLTTGMKTLASASVPWRVALVLVCGAVGIGLCHAEELRGVLYSDLHGQGVHPAGTVELAIGKAIYSFEYGEPLERHFSSKVCRDIGAIWSVKVQVFRDSRYLSRVVCSGSVDESVHGPWLAVRKDLDGLPSSVSRSEALSSRWRSSPEFGRFASLVRSAELSFYSPSADEGSCIRPTTVEPLKRTRLIAHCSIELHGKLVDLVFDVVRNTRTAKWEIDATQIK